MSKVVTVGEAVEMTISQEDLCLAVGHWLKEKLGITQPLGVTQVRTRAHQARSAEVRFVWSMQDENSSD